MADNPKQDLSPKTPGDLENHNKAQAASDRPITPLQGRPGNISCPDTPQPQKILPAGLNFGTREVKTSIQGAGPKPSATSNANNEAAQQCHEGHSDCPAMDPKVMKDVGVFAELHGLKLVPANKSQVTGAHSGISRQLLQQPPPMEATAAMRAMAEARAGGYMPGASSGNSFLPAPYSYPYGGYAPPPGYPGWTPNPYSYGPYHPPFQGYPMAGGGIPNLQSATMGGIPGLQSGGMGHPMAAPHLQPQQQRRVSMPMMGRQVPANVSSAAKQIAASNSTGLFHPNKPNIHRGQPMGALPIPSAPGPLTAASNTAWATPGVRLPGTPYARICLYPNPDVHVLMPTTDHAILLGSFVQYLRENESPGLLDNEIRAYTGDFWKYIQHNFPPTADYKTKESNGKLAMANLAKAAFGLRDDVHFLNANMDRLIDKKPKNPKDLVVPSKEERPMYLKNLKDALLRITEETVDATRPNAEKIRNADPNDPMWTNAAEKLLYALEKRCRDMVDPDEPHNCAVTKAKRYDFDQQFNKAVKYLETCKGGCIKLTQETHAEQVARDPGSRMRDFMKATSRALARESKDADADADAESPHTRRTTRKASEEIPEDGQPPPTKFAKTDSVEVRTPSVQIVAKGSRTATPRSDLIEGSPLAAKVDKVKALETPLKKIAQIVSAEVRTVVPPQIGTPKAAIQAPAIAKPKPTEGRIAKTKAKDDTSGVYDAMYRFVQEKEQAEAKQKAKTDKS